MKIALSPPAYTLYSQIQKALGGDPHVHVMPMQNDGSTYEIRLVVGDDAKAVALAKTLLPEHELGEETVRVTVIDVEGRAYNNEPDDQAGDIAATIDDAFRSNPLFREALVADRKPAIGIGQVIAVFAPKVIQFFNDDLADYYYNANRVAADVFADLLRVDYPNEIALSITTEPGQ